MNITIQGLYTNISDDSTGLTITVGGVELDDTLIAILTKSGTLGTTSILPGWTKHAGLDAGDSILTEVWYKLADANEVTDSYDFSKNPKYTKISSDVDTTTPGDIIWSVDGTYLFINDLVSGFIQKYSVNHPFSISSGLSLVGSSTTVELHSSGAVSGFDLSQDGETLYLLNSTDLSVYEYDITGSAADLYNIYPVINFISKIDIDVDDKTGISYVNNGYTLYYYLSGSNILNRYELTVPYDPTTKGAPTSTKVIWGDGSLIVHPGEDFFFGGRTMFKMDPPGDVSTAEETQWAWNFGIALIASIEDRGKYFGCGEHSHDYDRYIVAEFTTPGVFDPGLHVTGSSMPYVNGEGATFTNDGYTLYLGNDTYYLHQYTLTTPYDVSTSSLVYTATPAMLIHTTGGQSYAYNMCFSSDGLTMYLQGNTEISGFTLNAAWDISQGFTSDVGNWLSFDAQKDFYGKIYGGNISYVTKDGLHAYFHFRHTGINNAPFITHYALASAHDLSTATLQGSYSCWALDSGTAKTGCFYENNGSVCLVIREDANLKAYRIKDRDDIFVGMERLGGWAWTDTYVPGERPLWANDEYCDISMSVDGTHLISCDRALDEVFAIRLPIPFDITGIKKSKEHGCITTGGTPYYNEDYTRVSLMAAGSMYTYEFREPLAYVPWDGVSEGYMDYIDEMPLYRASESQYPNAKSPGNIRFSPTGIWAYEMCNYSNIVTFNTSRSPFMLTTGCWDEGYIDIAETSATCMDLTYSPDGLTWYILKSNGEIFQYTSSVAWIPIAGNLTYDGTTSIVTSNGFSQRIIWLPDGLSFWVMVHGNPMQKFSVSVAWDLLSTITDLSIDSADIYYMQMALSPDGTTFYMKPSTSDTTINRYTIPSAFDFTSSWTNHGRVGNCENQYIDTLVCGDGRHLHVVMDYNTSTTDSVVLYRLKPKLSTNLSNPIDGELKYLGVVSLKAMAGVANISGAIGIEDSNGVRGHLLQTWATNLESTTVFSVISGSNGIPTAYGVEEYVGYSGNSKDISAQVPTNPNSLTFSTDGLHMYVGSGTSNIVFEYSLSIAWDLGSTVTYTGNSFNSPQDANVKSVKFSDDGTKLYVLGAANSAIYEYTVSVPWDLGSTITYTTHYLSVSAEGANGGLAFSKNGKKVHGVNNGNGKVHQYSAGTKAMEWIGDLQDYAGTFMVLTGADLDTISVVGEINGTNGAPIAPPVVIEHITSLAISGVSALEAPSTITLDTDLTVVADNLSSAGSVPITQSTGVEEFSVEATTPSYNNTITPDGLWSAWSFYIGPDKIPKFLDLGLPLEIAEALQMAAESGAGLFLSTDQALDISNAFRIDKPVSKAVVQSVEDDTSQAGAIGRGASIEQPSTTSMAFAGFVVTFGTNIVPTNVTNVDTAKTTSASITIVSPITLGNLMIAVVSKDGSASTSVNPTGWNLELGATSSGAIVTEIWSKTAVAGDTGGNVTYTWGNANETYVITFIEFAGADPTTMSTPTYNAATSATATHPSQDTPTANNILVAGMAIDDGEAPHNLDNALTVIVEGLETTGGGSGDVGQSIGYELFATASTTPVYSSTASASDQNLGWSFYLGPRLGYTIGLLGAALESDTPLAMIAEQISPEYGRADETDSAHVMTVEQSILKLLALASDTSTSSAMQILVPQTILAGLAVENDLSTSATGVRLRAVIQALENDGSFTTEHTKALYAGLALSSDSALTMDSAKIALLALALENDSSFIADNFKSYGVVTATEADSATAGSFSKAKDISETLENDMATLTAHSISAEIGSVIEEDIARLASTLRTLHTGIATENNAAYAALWSKLEAILQATEADLSNDITAGRQYTLLESLESNLSYLYTSAKDKSVALSQEVDSANTFASSVTLQINLATETDIAFLSAHTKQKIIGSILEADLGYPMGTLKEFGITQAVGDTVANVMLVGRLYDILPSPVTDSGLPLTVDKLSGLSEAVTSNIAQDVSSTKINSILSALETDSSDPFSSVKISGISLTIETDQSLSTDKTKELSILMASEINSAFDNTGLKVHDISYVTENDSGTLFTKEITAHTGLASDISIAQLVGHDKVAYISLAADISTGKEIQPTFGLNINTVIDQSSSIPFTSAKELATGLVLELDSALSSMWTKQQSISIAQEADTPFSHTWSINKHILEALSIESATDTGSDKASGVDQGSDTELAGTIHNDKLYKLNISEETNAALSIDPSVSTKVLAGLALENDAGTTYDKIKSLAINLSSTIATGSALVIVSPTSLGQASDDSLANAVEIAKGIAMALAEETDTAADAIPDYLYTIGQANELDAADTAKAAKVSPIGEASTVDWATAFTRSILLDIGLAIETDISLDSTQLYNVIRDSMRYTVSISTGIRNEVIITTRKVEDVTIATKKREDVTIATKKKEDVTIATKINREVEL